MSQRHLTARAPRPGQNDDWEPLDPERLPDDPWDPDALDDDEPQPEPGDFWCEPDDDNV
jgi:hypothetical protein